MIYTSTPGKKRDFCGKRGSPFLFQSQKYPNELHLYVSLLDDPSLLMPTEHAFTREMLPWIHLDDGLPRE